jgi:DNA-binding transcriptional regulator GbsR (MarR family)
MCIITKSCKYAEHHGEKMREQIEEAGIEAKPGGGRNEEAVMRFVERFALRFSEAGVPRMPARVFAALLVSDDGRRTAAELAETLRVSPAAVSNAVRYLQQVGLVIREREPGERRDHYRVHGGDTWYEVTIRRDQMLMRWQEDLREGIEAVGADTPAGKRLEETRRFYEFVHKEIPMLMEKWRKVRTGSAADEAG